MLDFMFIIIVLIFIAIIIRASLIKIVPVLKPVKTPAIRIENIMKDADDMEYPISDEENAVLYARLKKEENCDM